MTIAAGLALLLTLPCVFLAFALMRPAQAAAACMLGCVLFMPELVNFDLPVLPAFDKRSLPPLSVFLATLAMAPERLRGVKWNWIDGLLALFALSTVVTSLYNQEPLQYGSLYIPGIGLTDTLSDLLRIVLVAVLPYYLGRIYSRNAADGEVLLGSLVMGNLLYLPLILYEMRMSPQLHRIVYGFAQHDFAQTIRAGGYRPMVFMAHGLALAMFVTAGVIAAYAIWQSGRMSGPLPAAAPALGLTALLVAFRSVGALVYGAVAVPMLTLLGARSSIQGFVLKLLMVVVLAYPTLRAEGIFPTERMVAAAGGPLSDRGQSLDFRFVNEDALLQRASQKKLFGWGSYGRNRVYDENGRDMAVTDGAWIISFGMYGYARLPPLLRDVRRQCVGGNQLLHPSRCPGGAAPVGAYLDRRPPHNRSPPQRGLQLLQHVLHRRTRGPRHGNGRRTPSCPASQDLPQRSRQGFQAWRTPRDCCVDSTVCPLTSGRAWSLYFPYSPGQGVTPWSRFFRFSAVFGARSDSKPRRYARWPLGVGKSLLPRQPSCPPRTSCRASSSASLGRPSLLPPTSRTCGEVPSGPMPRPEPISWRTLGSSTVFSTPNAAATSCTHDGIGDSRYVPRPSSTAPPWPGPLPATGTLGSGCSTTPSITSSQKGREYPYAPPTLSVST